VNALSPLYWIETPWRGRLAVAPRPRGGDWLEDEISGWKRAGIDAVASLLTPDEVEELHLAREASLSVSYDVRFYSLPIPDRDIPPSDAEAVGLARDLLDELTRGRDVLIHCRQGVGRSGMIAAAVLVAGGDSPDAAFSRISKARGVETPETEPQRLWLVRMASILQTQAQKTVSRR
jgi:protein-tyrosine phosphatase